VSRDHRNSRQGGGKRIRNRLLGRPHIADQCGRLEVRGDGLGSGFHRADRNAQDHQIGIAHRIAWAIADCADEAALGRASAGGAIGIVSGGDGAR
jgi:hypothetical protein